MTSMKARIRLRSRARSLRARWRNRDRALPDFLILGTQKGGTVSLYQHLTSLPGVIGVEQRWKEVHYFASIPNPNNYPMLGPGWYRSHFPRRDALRAAGAITGEATPRYMVEALAMSRIARDLPDSRWIVVLRDPVERAHSHHTMQVRHGVETSAFGDAIDHELELIGRGVVIEGTTDVIGDDRDYIGGGRYSEQLRSIGALRPDRPTLVLFSENLFAGHRPSFELLHRFLDLPAPEHTAFPHVNRSSSEEKGTIDPALRAVLESYFSDADADLSAQLNSDRFLTVDPEDWPDWTRRMNRIRRTAQ